MLYVILYLYDELGDKIEKYNKNEMLYYSACT